MQGLANYSRGILIGITLTLTLLCTLIIVTIMSDLKPPLREPDLTLVTDNPPNVSTSSLTHQTSPTPPPTLSYVMVTSSCDYNFNGDCLNVRTTPSLEGTVVTSLRNGVVLRADTENPIKADGHTWYRVVFDETLRYPERVSSEWYISSDSVEPLSIAGPFYLASSTLPTNKRIVVDRSEQTLRAYTGDVLFMEIPISTGLSLTPTPRGEFKVYLKTPTRYMQGPLPGIADQYYDLPGVPWNLYFTKEGAVIHGAYWHQSFGKPYSHGCVNVEPTHARTLYEWADLGTTVLVQD